MLSGYLETGDSNLIGITTRSARRLHTALAV